MHESVDEHMLERILHGNEELAEAYHRMEEWGRENSRLQNQSLVNA